MSNKDPESSNSSEVNEQDLYRIFDSMPAAVLIYDISENSIVYANKIVERLAGYSFAEMKQMGSSILEKLLHPEDLQGYIDAAMELSILKSDEIKNYTYRVITKDGRVLKITSKRMVFKRDAKGNGIQVLSMGEVASE